MNREEIKRLVSKSETAAVEFKRGRGGVPADFWPSYSAFANTEPSIVESYEPDRTKVTVEYDPDEPELGVMASEVRVIDSELGEKTGEVIGNATEVKEKTSEVMEKASEVGEKNGVSDDVKAGSVHVKSRINHSDRKVNCSCH